MKIFSKTVSKYLQPSTVNEWIRIIYFISIIALVLLLAGCGDIGIGEIDTKNYSMKLKLLPEQAGDFEEVIVNIREQDRSFQTLQRVNNQLKMRNISYDGKVLGEQTIPLLFQGYAAKDSYAVSPDGRKIIYFNYDNNGLSIYDTANKTDSPLMDGVDSSVYSIMKIHFISQDEIVLMLRADELGVRTGNAIIKFNIVTKIAKTIIEPIYIEIFKLSFSKSNRYLAYWEGNEKFDRYGDFRILDLQTDQIVATIKNPGNVEMSMLSWSPNEQIIACRVKNSLVTVPLYGNPVRIVKTFSKDIFIHSLAFLDDRTLIYQTGDNPWRNALTSLNIDTGKEIRYYRRRSFRDIFVVDNGHRIICDFDFPL